MTKQVFAEADVMLKALAGVRKDMAAIIAQAVPPVEDMPPYAAKIKAALERIEQPLADIAAHEAALRGAERDFVLKNDEASLAALDGRLRELASNRDRIGILVDEATARRASMQKAIEHEEWRLYALDCLRRRDEKIAVVGKIAEAEAMFREVWAAMKDAREIESDMNWKRRTHRDVEELQYPDNQSLKEPQRVLERLVKDLTDLRFDTRPAPPYVYTPPYIPPHAR